MYFAYIHKFNLRYIPTMTKEEKYRRKVEKISEAHNLDLISKKEYELLLLRIQNYYESGKDEEDDDSVLDIKQEELSPIGLRVKELISEKSGGSIVDFANAISYPYHTFIRVLKIDKRTNKYPPMTLEILEAICKSFPDINTEWLLTGIGSMYKPVGVKQYIKNGYQPIDGASLKIDGILDIYIEKGAIKKE